jgi:CO/xanthine dehydrogenase FAD-binding subunit
MITEYKRPTDLQEALELLSLPNARPLGGGTVLAHNSDGDITVVDLQALGLNKILITGNKLAIGATTTLSQLNDSPHTLPDMAVSIRLETPLNLRNMGTVAGTLVTCDGRSPFATVMLALDAKLTLESKASSPEIVGIGDFLAMRSQYAKKLITRIEIPLNVKLAFENVARTPVDRPIVCTALAQWPSGRTRLALGGWGNTPVLAMDGNEPGGVEAAAKNAYDEAGDQWASAVYRREIAAVLSQRCLEKISQ